MYKCDVSTGSLEERGIIHMANKETEKTENDKNENEDENGKQSSNPYDLPFGMHFIRRVNWLRYCPISPTFATKTTTVSPTPLSIF